jgi:hypothetical protein
MFETRNASPADNREGVVSYWPGETRKESVLDMESTTRSTRGQAGPSAPRAETPKASAPNSLGYRFTALPDCVLAAVKDKRLKPVDLQVLGAYLGFRTIRRTSAWSAIHTIVDRTGVSIATVQRSLHRLELAGFIVRTKVASPDPDEPANRTGWRVHFLFIEGAPRLASDVDHRSLREKWVAGLTPPEIAPARPGGVAKALPNYAGASDCPDELKGDGENDRSATIALDGREGEKTQTPDDQAEPEPEPTLEPEPTPRAEIAQRAEALFEALWEGIGPTRRAEERKGSWGFYLSVARETFDAAGTLALEWVEKTIRTIRQRTDSRDYGRRFTANCTAKRNGGKPECEGKRRGHEPPPAPVYADHTTYGSRPDTTLATFHCCENGVYYGPRSQAEYNAYREELRLAREQEEQRRAEVDQAENERRNTLFSQVQKPAAKGRWGRRDIAGPTRESLVKHRDGLTAWLAENPDHKLAPVQRKILAETEAKLAALGAGGAS